MTSLCSFLRRPIAALGLSFWLTLVLASAVHSSSVWADERDARFIEGLRQRRLFQLAETFCRERLASRELSPADRAELTVELIRVYSEHALNASRELRPRLWQQADDLASEFPRGENRPPRGVLVQVQAALTLLARGEWARLEAEVAADPEAGLEQPRQRLREAIRALRQIDRELTDEIPLRHRNPLRPDELSGEELTSLQYHVRYQLGRAYQMQALCYPEESADRTASLTAALEHSKQPRSQVPTDDPLSVEIRLQEAACRRLLGDSDVALRELDALAAMELVPRKDLEIKAERIRTLLSQGKHDEALQEVAAGRHHQGAVSPELDFAILETYVRLWQAAASANNDSSAKRRDQALAAAEFIEQTHGAYWGRRAELLLIQSGEGSGDESLEIVRRTADDLYLKGRFDDAVAAYDKAAAAALAADAAKPAFEFAYKAALVQQEQGLHESAARRFRELAIANPHHAHAANAHVQAIINLRQASSAAGVWNSEYAPWLREHLERWAGHTETASLAAFWLGEWEASRHAWEAAIDAFSKVVPDSAHYEAAIAKLGSCWQQRLQDLLTVGQVQPDTNQEQLQRALTFFRSVIEGTQSTLPEAWSNARRDATTSFAAIQLQYGDAAFDESERLLKAALNGSPEPGHDWRARATSLLILALAKQGREAEARQMLTPEAMPATRDLVALFQQISPLLASATQADRREIALLQLDVAAALDAKQAELTAAEKALLATGRAAALAAAGKVDEALESYAALAGELPRDASVQQGYGQLLLEQDDPRSLQLALEQWRRVAAASRPRTELWFRAKYSIALAQYKLGDRTAAAKLIRYLQASEDLSSSGLEQEFRDLLARCLQ